MSENRLELLYEIIISGCRLTITNLLNNGYTYEEIDILLEERIIIPINQNEYKLYSTYELYYYGIKLLENNQIYKANKCFIRCCQIDPNNRDFALRILIKYLRQGNHIQAFSKFSTIEKIESTKYKKDNDLYLYLISHITKCSDEYLSRLQNIEYNDFLYAEEDNMYQKDKHNIIRRLIMIGKFNSALNLLNTVIAKEKVRITSNDVLKELLIQVIKAQRNNKLMLLDMAKSKQYIEIYEFLKKKHTKIYLSNNETYIYMITKSIIDTINQESIQKPTIDITDSIYEALTGHNYVLAEFLNSQILLNPQAPIDHQIMDILLKDLNNIMSSYQIIQNNSNHTNILRKVKEK